MFTSTNQAAAFIHNFVRLEDKYLLPKNKLENLKRLIEQRSLESAQFIKREFYSIESTYFDSSELNIFQNHFTLLLRRSKLRVRSYFDFSREGDEKAVLKKTYHLELKVKENNICNKERLKINGHNFERLCQGKTIELDDYSRDKNSSIPMDVLKERIARINDEVCRYTMRPSCTISYERHALEESDFRMTFDDNLRFSWLQDIESTVAESLKTASFWERAHLMRENFRKCENVVVELKHKGIIPDWVANFFVTFPKANFSKYCFAVTESLEKL
jgi:hypothetical protein